MSDRYTTTQEYQLPLEVVRVDTIASFTEPEF